ncbi:Cationic amino acid transporter 5 [Morella rubra]|uniref:Cationic amino acid transporter 5 n=1 Tax=Morella rubra TaxID=262757 RepID=A0A6A1WF64_9ROSI|nr:Cationic amino acid transporter 5 [Morella rubra]
MPTQETIGDGANKISFRGIFSKLRTYRSALSQTYLRFKDRLISRSNDAEEIEELRKQSENDMKRCLTWWDLTWFGFGSVIGTGIFVLTGQEAHDHAGPAIVLSYVASGFAHAKTSNLTPFLPYGAKGIFQAAAIVYFAYGGFDNIATMAEETKNPSRDIPLGLLGSMSIITVIYCLMALALAMMQKYTDIDREAPYSLAFQSVGMKWAKYLVALGALKGMTTVLLVGALGQARYVTHIARAHMIPPWFALVHPQTGTPINATLLITISSACIAFFSSLDVLAGLLSVSTLFIFTMMPVALLVRRYYVREITPRINLLKLVIFLLIIIASSMATAAC